MKIYVDIDDVLSETARSLCNLAEIVFNKKVLYEDVHDFDLQKVFCLTDDEIKYFMELSHKTENLMKYEVVEGAVCAIRQLQRFGCDIDFVTGRPAYTSSDTEAWLKKAGFASFKILYVDKYNRAYPESENEVQAISMKELLLRKYDIVIDDSPVALNRLVQWHDTKIIVYGRPWNKNYKLSANMIRLCNWEEILKYCQFPM